MEMNNFYISPLTILDRLTRVHKNKQIQLADVVEWSAECTTEYIEDFDSFVRYDGVQIKREKNNRFYLPCLVYRILDIYTGDGRAVGYKRRAGFIELNDTTIDTVYMDYIGIPVTDEGEICIDKNHAQAVEAFIVHKLYYEDYLNQKLHPNMWQDITLRMENELLAARGSFRHWDQRRFETMTAIHGDMIPDLAKVPLFRYYNTAEK